MRLARRNRRSNFTARRPTWSPRAPEPYVLGLRLARELKDYAAVRWTATGVLTSVWGKDYEQLHREAEDAALEAERACEAPVRRKRRGSSLRRWRRHESVI